MNTMKTVLVVLGIIIAIVGGYVLFAQRADAPTTGTSNGQPVQNGAAAKIDIDAVCSGALAYMTFPSGIEADAFVEACKRGEHPEVIEQWKVQMGITDDRVI